MRKRIFFRPVGCEDDEWESRRSVLIRLIWVINSINSDMNIFRSYYKVLFVWFILNVCIVGHAFVFKVLFKKILVVITLK